jgi:GTP-binding protein Era
MAEPHRSGLAALIGRPNVGKSTLLNRLTGEKIAIVSPKPQTTRQRILGVVTRPHAQVAFLDTPGIHQARGALNHWMVDVALAAIGEVDLVLYLIEAPARLAIDPANRFILDRLSGSHKATVLGINKIDEIAKPRLLPLIDLYRKEAPFLEIVPLSAKTGEGVDGLFDAVAAHLPEGESLFPADTLTDQAERTLVAEYIREQVLRQTRQEVPYSTAVLVEVFDESEREPRPGPRRGRLAGLVRIAATLYVERESQKAILVGKRGQMLKSIGTDARHQVERLLGTHVYLSLRVKVEPDWSERPGALRKMGYA